jgi:hypothetical protein
MLWINRAQPNVWAITAIKLSVNVFRWPDCPVAGFASKWLPRMRPEGMTKVQLLEGYSCTVKVTSDVRGTCLSRSLRKGSAFGNLQPGCRTYGARDHRWD